MTVTSITKVMTEVVGLPHRVTWCDDFSYIERLSLPLCKIKKKYN